jgi:hypothetical protein
MVLGRDNLSHVSQLSGEKGANPIELKAGQDETCGGSWQGQFVPSVQTRKAALADCGETSSTERRRRLGVRHSQHGP